MLPIIRSMRRSFLSQVILAYCFCTDHARDFLRLPVYTGSPEWISNRVRVFKPIKSWDDPHYIFEAPPPLSSASCLLKKILLVTTLDCWPTFLCWPTVASWRWRGYSVLTCHFTGSKSTPYTTLSQSQPCFFTETAMTVSLTGTHGPSMERPGLCVFCAAITFWN